VEDLDRTIEDLERSVERGELKLVDERKTLSEISKSPAIRVTRLISLLI
jgi:hypothetical protein